MLCISFIVTNDFVWGFTPYFLTPLSFPGHFSDAVNLSQALQWLHLDLD